jgi:four helix bundle protein
MTATELQAAQRKLQGRTLTFARDVRAFVSNIPRTISNIEDGKQLIRSSGSVGANYIEACEAMSKRDAIRILKICRRESKECRFWLNLINTGNQLTLETQRRNLASEAEQFLFIFSSIISKLTSKDTG